MSIVVIGENGTVVVVVVVVVWDDGVDVDKYKSLLTVTHHLEISIVATSAENSIVAVPTWTFCFCLQYFEQGNLFYYF